MDYTPRCSNSDDTSRRSENMVARENEGDDDEEDFLPSIPEALLQVRHGDSPTMPKTTGASLRAESKKRARSPTIEENNNNNNKFDNAAAEDVCFTKETDDQGKEDFMELLRLEGFPTTSLYERSYRHETSVHDIGVLHDEIGSMISTVDASGTLRVWRKLPRGVFFMGDLQGMFSSSAVSKDVNNTAKYFILTDIFTPTLFVVCIVPHVERTAGIVTVDVEIRLVNSTLMTVETRLSFCFSVTLRTNTESSFWKESVTPRPFLLYHDHQPLLAFFIMEGDGVSKVLFFPCVAEKSIHSSNMAMVVIPSVPLSTANIVLCCHQHQPSGIVVLVDEKGIIDYARIVGGTGDEGQRVVSLQVLSGAPPRNSMDPMTLRKWITFERRQKTGFYTLLREAMILSKRDGMITMMIPLRIAFSTTGKYFVVASGVLREGCSVSVCLHVFEFSTGAFLTRGETDETKVSSVFFDEGKSLQAEVLPLLRGAVFDILVEDAVRKLPQGRGGGVWVFVPEIVFPTSFDGRVSGRRIFAFRAAPSVPKEVTQADARKHSKHMPEASFEIEKMWRPIGDVEKNIREMVISSSSSTLSMPCMKQRIQHFAAPLGLIRATVSVSQALKNLVAQSPVGSALSQEDIKRLFVVPSRTAVATTAAASSREEFLNASDPTFCTTSLGGTALLLYTKYEAQLEEHSELKPQQRNLKTNHITDADDRMESKNMDDECQVKMLVELHQKRDFDCSDLLFIQSSLKGVIPRKFAATDGEKEKYNEKGEENDSVTYPSIHNDNDNNDDELEYEVEERRVQHIITAATGRAFQWGKSCVRVSLVIESFGTIMVRLLPQFAPKTVRNFVSLSREGFYNGLTFHRVVPGFMIQGGCPLGDGTGGKSIYGGPFEDEGINVMEFFSYPTVYWLCMANAGPNTNESQFFITVGEATPWLNGKHTVFGLVVSGKPVVRAIVQRERGEDDKPIIPVVIQRVVATEEEDE